MGVGYGRDDCLRYDHLREPQVLDGRVVYSVANVRHIEPKSEERWIGRRRWAVVVPSTLLTLIFGTMVFSGFNPLRETSVDIDWTSWDLGRGRFTVYGGRSSHDYDYWEVGPLTISQLVK